MGKKGGRVFRNNYKGHMDKNQGGMESGTEVGMAGMGKKKRLENHTNSITF